MVEFSDWVPDEIVKLYGRLKNEEKVEGIPKILYASQKFQKGIELLGSAMLSESMKKTWRAVTKRSAKADPIEFAKVILNMYMVNLRFHRVPSSAEVAAWQRLATDINKSLEKYYQSAGKLWDVEELELLAIGGAAGEIQDVADVLVEERQELAFIAGKANSASANRTFLIRIMAAKIMRLYEQPLYAVVAETVALILDEEPLDSNHVMKLVKSKPNLPLGNLFIG